MLSSIIDSCRPRDGILQGTFNPEIFTANLSGAERGRAVVTYLQFAIDTGVD